MTKDHFKGKEAIRHVAEKQAEGILTSQEIHGLEISGSKEAFCDAARESSLLMAILLPLLATLDFSVEKTLFFMTLFFSSFALFRGARSALLSWARLERLHRLLEQERWEIQHNRPQEREELQVLYKAKGFDGELLENVVDVLMSDDDRLLKVMIEEEMKLSLSHVDHPMKQALFAAFGVLLVFLFSLVGFAILGIWGSLACSFIALLAASLLSAIQYGNRKIDALMWNGSLYIVTLLTTLFLRDWLWTPH